MRASPRRCLFLWQNFSRAAEPYIVKSTDLVDRGYGKSGVDFLKCTTPFNGDIITNPPYKYAQEFVEHALELIPNGHKVAMFLKLTFLESKNRRSLFESNPPVLYMSHRADCSAQKVETSIPITKPEQQ